MILTQKMMQEIAHLKYYRHVMACNTLFDNYRASHIVHHAPKTCT